MKIGIIDADLVGKKKHRFPNLACMKLSGYHKDNGDMVELKLDYNNIEEYDKVYISKVFSATPVDEAVLKMANVSYGGTGFYYDKAPRLIDDIEHHMPDYHLYDQWVSEMLSGVGGNKVDFKYYTDYSIGFITRGCFRQCDFCVNKNYKKVEYNSNLSEFLDIQKKKICLLDDNFFGYPHWKDLLHQLQGIGKPFQFKQGLDERLLADDKCKELFKSKYDGDYIFAFDNIEDYDLIKLKIELMRKYTDAVPKFYCFCGFDRGNKWDLDFWYKDIIDLFRRIELLMQYRCLPYIMRYEKYKDAPKEIYGLYIEIARWCNQPSLFKKKSFVEFVEANNSSRRTTQDRYDLFITKHPDFPKRFFEMKWN